MISNPEYIIGGLVGGIVAATGTGLLFLLKHFVTRYSKRVDKREVRSDALEAEHVTNQGKQIDADSEAFKIIAERLQEVEDRFDKKIEKLTDELTSQKVMNAKKDAQIEHLTGENDRLRERCSKQDREIADLRIELNALKLIVTQNGPQPGQPDATGKSEDPIHVMVDEPEGEE